MDADFEIMHPCNTPNLCEVNRSQEGYALEGDASNLLFPKRIPDSSGITFFGLTVHPKSLEDLNGLVEQSIVERRKWLITNHNLHSTYLFHRFPKLREFYSSAHWIFIDGMSLVGLGRFYGHQLERKHRVTLVDWMPQLMELAALKSWRVFYLGSPKGVAAKGATILRRRYPDLQIEVSDGYFDVRQGSMENEALLQRINAYHPDVVMVGMGMPRQEYWTYDNFDQINAHVVLSSNGAGMDYIAGAVRTPPRWAGRLGLEWAYRLINEPRRLFSRYLVEPWYILALLLLDQLRGGGKLKATIQREG